MKLQGMAGKGSGKLGSQVYAISGGEQIVRQYNPTVTNPSTEGQVETRSKFKLLSQLSAALSGVIAIKREGLVSGRNQFMKINKENAVYAGADASINLNHVQITKSNRGLANFNADRTGGASISVSFGERVDANIDKAVYAGFIKDDDGSLTKFGSVVVNIAGASGDFPAELPYTDKSVVIYAYGIKVTSDRAYAAFGNMVCPSAEQVAKLMTTSSDVATGTAVTKTKGLTMLEGTDTGSSDDDTHFTVSVAKSGIGSVSGGGRFNAGLPCTVVATPAGGSTFVAWKRGSASGETVSTSASYTFEVTTDVELVAVFEGGEIVTYDIEVDVNPNGGGTVQGAGTYEIGDTCTIIAIPSVGYVFVRFESLDGSFIVSTDNPYRFTVDRKRHFVARFALASEFTDVTYGGSDWNENKSGTVAGGIPAITGSVTAQGADHVALFKAESKPAIDSNAGNMYQSYQGTGAFTLPATTQGLSAGRYWLAAVEMNGATGENIVKAVFDYSIVLS